VWYKRYGRCHATDCRWEQLVRGGETVSEHDQLVGSRLAAARKRAGLTQAEAAKRLGFAQSRVAKLETGTRRLLFSEAISFADLYGAALAELAPEE
jgi:DNA-binding XRE family transcriptional regulator